MSKIRVPFQASFQGYVDVEDFFNEQAASEYVQDLLDNTEFELKTDWEDADDEHLEKGPAKLDVGFGVDHEDICDECLKPGVWFENHSEDE